MAPLRLVEIAQHTDTGRVRAHNEDRALAVAPLLVVADGMGGAKAGEVAAQITIDTLAGTGPQPSVDQVVDAIADANREIRSLSQSDPDHAGMGTTVTAVLVRDDSVTALHVGDSRAYVVRGGQIRQVTEDHSLVGELVRQGQITAAEAEVHPSRNIITRALGAEVDVDVDRVPLQLEPDDVVLVCSDGLTTMVGIDEITQIVAEASSLREASQSLVSAALAAGGTDNVTVILGRVGHDDQPIVHDAGPATTEFPAVESEQGDTAASGSQSPARRRITGRLPRRDDEPASTRPAVLEGTHRGRRPNRRPAIPIVIVAVLAAIGLSIWAASRVYFVDARDGAQSAQIYHGFPVSVLGIDLHTTWSDLGVNADAIGAVEPGVLSGDVRGKGEAVLVASRLIWRYGLPEVAVLQLPDSASNAQSRTRTTQ